MDRKANYNIYYPDIVKPRPKPPLNLNGYLVGAFFVGISAFGVAAASSADKEQSHNGLLRRMNTVSVPTATPESRVELITIEQEEAKRLFEGADEKSRVYNVTVYGEFFDEKVGVRLRDRPYSAETKTHKTGEVVGFLPRGARIPSAVVVFGNHPNFPDRGDNQLSRWLAFPNPENPDVIAFAYAGYFDQTAGLNLIPAVVLGQSKTSVR